MTYPDPAEVVFPLPSPFVVLAPKVIFKQIYARVGMKNKNTIYL